MADLTITAANVVKAVSAKTVEGVAGATITAGELVYLDATDNTYKLCDSDATPAAANNITGVALVGASSGQPLILQKSGNLDLGATLVVGQIYCLSTTAGGIAPFSDLTTGDFVSILGVATATDNLLMGIINSGAQVQ